MVEEDFLSCGKCFLLLKHFFYKRKPSLKLVETHLLAKYFISAGRKGFSVQWKLFFSEFYCVVFLCKLMFFVERLLWMAPNQVVFLHDQKVKHKRLNSIFHHF